MPPTLLLSLRQHRGLVATLARREVQGRFRGTLLGRFWLLAAPILMLGVYTLVFAVVFPARWPLADGSISLAAAYLLAGLCLSTAMADYLGRAPGWVQGRPNFVTKVRFPLEILPVVEWAPPLIALGVSLAFTVLLATHAGHPPGLTLLAMPLVVLPFLVLLAGAGFIASALGVYFRDLQQLMAPVLAASLFLSPILYPRESAPEALAGVLTLNPLTIPVEQLRRVLLEQQWPQWDVLGTYALIAIVVLVVGSTVFSHLRRGFADVI